MFVFRYADPCHAAGEQHADAPLYGAKHHCAASEGEGLTGFRNCSSHSADAVRICHQGNRHRSTTAHNRTMAGNNNIDHAICGKTINTERSEEHTSELQSTMRISYAVCCLKKKTSNKIKHNKHNDNEHIKQYTSTRPT